MTREEQARLKVEAMNQLAGLRRRLACYTTKAERLGAALDLARRYLNEAKTGGVYLDEALNPRDSWINADTWPSWGDVLETFDGARATRDRIAELEERFREWGVIPT